MCYVNTIKRYTIQQLAESGKYVVLTSASAEGWSAPWQCSAILYNWSIYHMQLIPWASRSKCSASAKLQYVCCTCVCVCGWIIQVYVLYHSSIKYNGESEFPWQETTLKLVFYLHISYCMNELDLGDCGARRVDWTWTCNDWRGRNLLCHYYEIVEIYMSDVSTPM